MFDKLSEKICFAVGGVTALISGMHLSEWGMVVGLIASLTSVYVMLCKNRREQKQHELQVQIDSIKIKELIGRRTEEKQDTGERHRATDEIPVIQCTNNDCKNADKCLTFQTESDIKHYYHPKFNVCSEYKCTEHHFINDTHHEHGGDRVCRECNITESDFKRERDKQDGMIKWTFEP